MWAGAVCNGSACVFVIVFVFVCLFVYARVRDFAYWSVSVCLRLCA